MCRIVFSAHSHRYCDRLYEGRTREVTVPSFSWRNRDDPAFLLASLNPNGSTTTSLCPIPRESIVLGTYAVMGTVICTYLLCVGMLKACCRRRVGGREKVE